MEYLISPSEVASILNLVRSRRRSATPASPASTHHSLNSNNSATTSTNKDNVPLKASASTRQLLRILGTLYVVLRLARTRAPGRQSTVAVLSIVVIRAINRVFSQQRSHALLKVAGTVLAGAAGGLVLTSQIPAETAGEIGLFVASKAAEWGLPLWASAAPAASALSAAASAMPSWIGVWTIFPLANAQLLHALRTAPETAPRGFVAVTRFLISAPGAGSEQTVAAQLLAAQPLAAFVATALKLARYLVPIYVGGAALKPSGDLGAALLQALRTVFVHAGASTAARAAFSRWPGANAYLVGLVAGLFAVVNPAGGRAQYLYAARLAVASALFTGRPQRHAAARALLPVALAGLLAVAACDRSAVPPAVRRALDWLVAAQRTG